MKLRHFSLALLRGLLLPVGLVLAGCSQSPVGPDSRSAAPAAWDVGATDGGTDDGTLPPDIADTDGDGIDDWSDDCPWTPDPDQDDLDEDGAGDACQGDYDADGAADDEDNCPGTPNADQADEDGDGIGDACGWVDEPPVEDGDSDGDGWLDSEDVCPWTFDPDQEDADGNGIGDACERPDDGGDPCVIDGEPPGDGTVEPNGEVTCVPEDLDPDGDEDGDSIANGIDNCVYGFNPLQEDTNGDGWGDVCDVVILDPGSGGDGTPQEGAPPTDDSHDDADGDGFDDADDNCPETPNDGQLDTDGDGRGNKCDSFDLRRLADDLLDSPLIRHLPPVVEDLLDRFLPPGG